MSAAWPSALPPTKLFPNICPAHSVGENSSRPMRDVMSQPQVAAIVLTKSSSIAARCHCQFFRALRSLRITGASSSSQTRWHRFEAVVVFCAAPLLVRREASRGCQRPIPSQGRGCQSLLTTPIPSMSPVVAAHQIVTWSLSHLLLQVIIDCAFPARTN
jgi:hypothetical protein